MVKNTGSDIVFRYWPDGLHTPPSLEAMVYDLRALKEVGYNMVRKHVSGDSQLIKATTDRPSRSKSNRLYFIKLVISLDFY